MARIEGLLKNQLYLVFPASPAIISPESTMGTVCAKRRVTDKFEALIFPWAAG
jgi:hypothetical protein